MDRLGPFMEELGLLILQSMGEPLKVSLHESDVGGSFLEMNSATMYREVWSEERQRPSRCLL